MTTNATAKIDPAFLQNERPMLIGGQWQGAASGKTFAVYNPATGEVIANVAEGDKEDVDLAVAAAGAAFKDKAWRYMAPAQRARLLWRLADLVEENAEEFAEIETLNQGKPLELARHLDIPVVCEAFRYFAGWCTKIEGTTNNVSLPDLRGGDTIGPAYHAYTMREPVGVVGLIVPWNFPLLMAAAKLGPALAVGCTCILKPAEETPLTALRLGELIEEAGFPEGVVNIVTGYGHTAGAAISAHPDVDKVAFTGSTEVGKLIAQAATDNLKKVSLELGGKSPAVVFADADLDIAIKGAASSIFLNTGQVCFAGSRLLVERPVYDQVVEGVAAIANNIKVGAGQEPDSEMGPVISSKQLERICGYIDQGVSDGAEVVTGGERDVVVVDKELPAAMRAALPCGVLTGAGAVLNSFAINARDSLLITGSGAVGLSAIMAGKIAGAWPLIAVDILDSRLDLAKELGASHIINAKDGDITKKVKEIMPRGVKYALDTTANEHVLNSAINCLGMDGHCGIVTPPHMGEVYPFPLTDLFIRAGHLDSIFLGSSNPSTFIPKIIEYNRQGRFPYERLITEYNFTDINKAFEDVKAGNAIKPVLMMT